MATSTSVTFRIDPPEMARLEEVRRLLAERNPGLNPSRSDALRFIINTGSSSAIAAAEPMGKTKA